ncbi:flagellar hook-basal body complex protein [Aestuariibacter sp. AA17]|uniref:Flagellar hook-basal body complex protein n=1 Tax=Fluctibacter corallii TaxID=2984329 RepID=A0ABT3A9H2_9ALTE|nr:flagellar hook-basal body complex protein [Aestuariibacter sp. AA17]MCV2885323.1 flagellar hook-basal body complex protein [Aestuariibacter sp. AA17]
MIEKIVNDSINLQLLKLSNTSNNLANASTPGYLPSGTFIEVVEGQQSVQRFVNADSLKTAIRQTENPLELAVMNGGMFIVEKQGQQYLTQDGRFHINSDGNIAHISGAYPVTSEGTQLTEADTSLLSSLIQTVKPSAQHLDLQPQDQGLYTPQWSQWNVDERANVLPQALNQTRQSTTTDVVNMLETQRAIESLQKAYQTYDTTVSYGISELGRK